MTDPEPYREMAEEIQRIEDAVERLRALGEESDLPAVERNATRLAGVLETLSDNVPPELREG